MESQDIINEVLSIKDMFSDECEHDEEDKKESVTSKKRAGRPKKYSSDQERKEAKRKHALEAYYRKKAKRAAAENGLIEKQALISDVIELMIDTTASKELEGEVKPRRFKITGELKLIAIQE